jgi:hypothetical protein
MPASIRDTASFSVWPGCSGISVLTSMESEAMAIRTSSADNLQYGGAIVVPGAARAQA